jgi:hypothetical protein
MLCGAAAAQDEGALVAQDVAVVPKIDIYGQEILFAQGSLANQDAVAYTNMNLEAIAYDADDEVIGGGFGYLVNACGAGLLPDFALQPDTAHSFAVPLELDEEGLTVERVEITALGDASDPTTAAAPFLLPGITEVSEAEVIDVEWVDEENLRFAAGCWRDLFDKWSWRDYNVRTGVQHPIEAPNAQYITPAMRQQLGLTDDVYFSNSKLNFQPNGRRMLYQNEINTFYSAEPDGSFKRLMLDLMSTKTLQGITWLNEGAFIAYYYGATGDPVFYFTGNVDGRVLSERPENNPTSLIAPGASPNGQRIVFAAEQEGQTGYYLKQAAYPGATLLFEADVPGNNWPGPLVEQDIDGRTFIYVALPEENGAQMSCFNQTTGELHELSALPLNLATDERAWWFLSPENNMIALAADGIHGGLWLIDLAELPSCE